MNAICIIPARGGSKRIPRKNIRAFRGRPIISYPIAAALASGCFGEVMVSTDDPEIAEVARTWGATVPFLRSSENSSDGAPSQDVFGEVLQAYASSQGRSFDAACAIYPTAALARPAQIREGWQKLQSDPTLTAVLPVIRFDFPIQRALAMRDGRVPMMWPEHYDSRSQDLEPAFHDAGQWYWFRPEPFLRTGELMGPNCAGIVIPPWDAQDIDDEEDWILAEMKFQCRLQMAS